MINRPVGFTTTIPLEILVAAKCTPIDLNNIFITHPDPQGLIDDAELAGFPRNICTWIKGIYGAALRNNINEIVAVTEGDCSNTHALMEVLSLHNVKTVPFAYPYDRSERSVKFEIEKLAAAFSVDAEAIAVARERLDQIRTKVHEIDRLTWQENKVTGGENHLYQVCTSDMNGDLDTFESEVDAFIVEAKARAPRTEPLRLAYIGVPPIMTDLYESIEALDARVVFNETQRQFSMPYKTESMVEQYRRYTYPYDIFTRLEDIKREIELRKIDGVIHYVQSFCFRQIEDMIVRQQVGVPVLTLEGDQPGPVDARTKIRLEGFVEMLEGRKK